MASKNILIIYCNECDLAFIKVNFTNIATDTVREFNLPKDTLVKARPSDLCEKDKLLINFNGQNLGNIIIIDERTNTTEDDRGLH